MKRPKAIPVHYRILTGMVVGIVAGAIVQLAGVDPVIIASINQWVKPVGDVFLRLIFMMVIPLIFCALILGVGEFSDLRYLRRIGLRTLAYTISVSIVSVIIGITMVTVFKPGSGIPEASRQQMVSQYAEQMKSITESPVYNRERSIPDMIVSIVPRNPIEDMVNAFNPAYQGGGILAVMFFSLMIGIALISVKSEKAAAFKATIEGFYEVIMKVIAMVMDFAPFGVASLLFVLISTTGWDVMLALSKYVAVVIAALAIHQFGTYSLLLKVLGKKSPIEFFKQIDEVMLTAFSTSSSNATLPTALRAAQDKLKLPKRVSNFVLTVGSTTNQNGTALFEGITILFLAQCFNIDLTFGKQIMVIVISILAGVGTAGVPGGSLPVMAIILVSVGIPAEAIGIIIGVDRILDMCRTVLNVSGDLTAAVVISEWERKESE
ncbi:MAG: dicarboxylate/amino acid:cation symporter [Bacteroidota bacterium]